MNIIYLKIPQLRKFQINKLLYIHICTILVNFYYYNKIIKRQG